MNTPTELDEHPFIYVAEALISKSPNEPYTLLLSHLVNHIKKQEAALSTQGDMVERLREALEFYADKNSWIDRWVDFGSEGRDGDVYDVIHESDVDWGEDEEGPYMTNGGKRARAALQTAPEGEKV